MSDKRIQFIPPTGYKAKSDYQFYEAQRRYDEIVIGTTLKLSKKQLTDYPNSKYTKFNVSTTDEDVLDMIGSVGERFEEDYGQKMTVKNPLFKNYFSVKVEKGETLEDGEHNIHFKGYWVVKSGDGSTTAYPDIRIV